MEKPDQAVEKPEFKGFVCNTMREIAACLYTSLSEPLGGGGECDGKKGTISGVMSLGGARGSGIRWPY